MIGTISVRETAKNSNFPLQPIYAFTSAPSHVRLIDLPKQIGTWKITSVSVSIVYPDGTSLISPCTLVGGCWSTTFGGCSTTGKVENGATVLADGVDELGQNVVGYVLGKGDIIVLDGSMEVSPDQPQTVFMRMCISGDVDNPKLGTMADIDGWKVYTLSGWQSLGMTLSDLSGKADLSDVQTLSAKVDAKADLSAVNATTAAINEALSDRPTKSQVEAGWWSEWTIMRGNVDVTNAVVAPTYEEPVEGFSPGWNVSESHISTDLEYDIHADGSETAKNITWEAIDSNTENPVRYSATRYHVEGLNASQTVFTYADGTTSAFNIVGTLNGNDVPRKSELVAAEIGSNVTCVGQEAFAMFEDDGEGGEVPVQTMLSNVVIPDSVTRIETGAFMNASIISVALPRRLTEIEDNVFDGCNHLSSVEVPYGVAEIGYSMFIGCSALSSIVIPNSVTSIGDWAFSNTSVISIAIPDSVADFGKAFYGCSALQSVVIGNGVTHIRDDTFRNCSALTGIVIPDNVMGLGSYSFFGCSSLKHAVVGNSVKSIPLMCFGQCHGIEDCVLGSNILSIENSGFYQCSSLTSIELPNSLEYIGDNAFSMLYSGISSIVVPDSVTYIGSNAFSMNNGPYLTRVTIGSGVQSIGQYSVFNTDSLREILVRGKTQSEAEALLSGQTLPSGCVISTWNDASQEWVLEQIQQAIAQLQS